MSKGTDLWNKAKRIIPGGNQLLSKRAEMFLPDQWPAYYQKAKGARIWDLDGNEFIDMSIMGIGTSVLGYANDQVNAAVIRAVENSVVSTLNCPEEVELTEKLLALHPWADMARYSRTGGEACTIAVRIGRAFSGKSKVAFCGYHGWHDWYLASNLADGNNLDGMLLPGLEPKGVPSQLRGSSLPFEYGNSAAFLALVEANRNELGVIIMEFAKQKKVDLDFIKLVQKTAREIGAVLIIDEVSSGFRLNIGGMHMLYGIEPDIVVLGKALGNGYAISAVLGKRDVMNAAQSTFISSTYWTERSGFVAALETIKFFEKHNVIEAIKNTGGILRSELEKIFQKHDLDIELLGLPTIIVMAIRGDDALEIKTCFTQEMLKRGFLASNVIFVSYAHTEDLVKDYLKNADEVFSLIRELKAKGSLKSSLNGPVCHSGFKRLN